MSRSDAQPLNRSRAAAELVVASMMWGFGFIATVWSLRSIGPLTSTGWRFFLAGVIGLGISWCIPSLRRDITKQQFWLAAPPGLLLCSLIFTQTWGLRYTTATKSGFITTLYVLFVPFLERAVLHRKIQRAHFVYVALGLLGTALICDVATSLNFTSTAVSTASAKPDLAAKTAWNVGDLLTLLTAILCTVHIVWFGLIQKKITSSFVFNGFQSIWACVIPLTLSFFLEPAPILRFSDLSLYGFMSLTFCSTLIAFALQVRAQKVLSPSLASLLFLLESPFATLFAVWLLQERLKTAQWIGAGLILLAAALSTALATED